MLTDRYSHLNMDNTILSAQQFQPFPAYSDRDGWQAVTGETRTEWMCAAEKYKDFTWPAITIDHYLLFNRTGNNMPYLKRFYERRSVLGILAIAECLEGKGRFLDQIINGIYCICEETTWITPFDSSLRNAVLPLPSDRLVDLSCSETGALLAWTCALLKNPLDDITPRIYERAREEIGSRLIHPYLNRDDYWWMGFVETPRINNWNPWCNRNMLMCFLLLEWERETRNAGILKAMRSLDEYMRKYPPDGCCDEGPMYWGAAGGGLHTCLKLLKLASSGKIDIYDEPMVRKIGQYIYKVHIHGDYYVDFADGDAIVGTGAGVFSYGLDIGDECLTGLGAGAATARNKPVVFNWFGMYEYLHNMFIEKERKACTLKAPYVRDAWMEYSQVMTAREQAGTEKGLYLAAKGGYNAESHNHNDVGNFIVYIDGKPLLIDIGTEEYTAKTFGPQRFELWYLQSQYHNCPTVRGILQMNGEQYRTRSVSCVTDDARAGVRMDIAGAYPEAAGIDFWIRTCCLERGECASVEIIDEFRLKTPAGDVIYSLMTPCEPKAESPGEIRLEYEKGRQALVRYDEAHLSVGCERIEITESRLKRNWGDVLYRIVLTEKTEVIQGQRKISITAVDTCR